MSKYSPSQLAKSTAALLSALATSVGLVEASIHDLLPGQYGLVGAAVAAVLVRWAVYVQKAEPTVEQVEQHVEAVTDIVKGVRPDLFK